MKKQPKFHAKKQKGFTLMEIIVVLALAGLILAGLAWGINRAFSANDVKNEAQGITGVLAALPDLRGAGGYPSGDLMDVLEAQEAIPSAWASGTNSWGGAVGVEGSGSGVVISTGSVPKAACNKLIMKLAGGGNFASVTIGGTAVGSPVTATSVAAACGGSNDIEFTTL